MSAPPEHLALAAEFPAVTHDQWRAMISAVLARSGVAEDLDPELALTSSTYDGISLKPLYTRDDALPVGAAALPGQAPFVRGDSIDGAGWDVRQRHCDPDVARTNAAVLADLSNGSTSLWLVLGSAGLAVADLPAALAGVYLDLAPVALDAGAQTQDAAETYLRLLAEQQIDPGSGGLPANAGVANGGLPGSAGGGPPASAGVAGGGVAAGGGGVTGSLGADPIGLQARTGAAADLSLLGELAALAADYPKLRVATVDATVYHDAGGSDSDELAVAAAVGVAYLRALNNGGPPGNGNGGTPDNVGVANGGPAGSEGVVAGGGGMSVDAALRVLEFRYAVTADQFLSIAKLRAARRVWDRIAELSGAGADRAGQRQHAVTSAAMMTQRDPWVNLLRATIACFAAAVGGAQAITVTPFDAAIGLSDELARRIARNTQSVLHDESSLARVIDAAGGSWYIESLTDQLAQAAWAKFTTIERAGGALAALDDGTIDRLIATARDQRADDIAHRRAPITGVSEYVFVGEQPVVRPPAPAEPAGGPLSRRRYAQDFEALRDRADAASARPTVFLAALGPSAAYRARVGFAANLFQAGGVEPIVGAGELDEIVAAFRAGTSTVACLCSANRLYAELAAPAAEALRAAGATHIWLAGSPGDLPGVDGYLFSGVDALDVLRTTLDKLGVA
ncbi:MAG: methylmalonyl-CoA mutase [Pseudonocardiales bacterium]|nr:MAG: methylmalonyl-CoA mutase [Pseudonocardiales bacterium]